MIFGPKYVLCIVGKNKICSNIDDALGVLILAKVPIAEKLHVDKTLPAIYSWCGYRAGISN